MTEEEQGKIEIVIDALDIDKYKRLDAFLADVLEEYSRTQIKSFFEQGLISLQGDPKGLQLKRMPIAGSIVSIEVPPIQSTDLVPQNIPLEILFEDEHLVIINKPAGMVVHPAPGNPDGTLVNAILYHCPDLKGIGNEKRPGIVHRLDKGTSGIMVVAKTHICHDGLVQLFTKHEIERAYQAIVFGTKMLASIRLESTIGRSPINRLKMAANVKQGKRAVTFLQVKNYFKHFSHLELKLETGRTHQIRVHLSEILKAPILNDETYGRIADERRLLPPELKKIVEEYAYPFLHAKVLGFVHPITKEKLHFTQAPPGIFQEALAILEKNKDVKVTF